MSIQTAIQNAQQKVANAYTAVSEKGGTLPATQNLSNLPAAIESISGGGGSFIGITREVSPTGVFQMPATSFTFSLPSNVTDVGNNAMYHAFHGCTGLTSVDLSSLTTVRGSSAMKKAFTNCTKLKTLSFPALTSKSFGSDTGQFDEMLTSVTGCTVHFPSNLQSVIGSWSSVTSGFGGTNTTVLFDLPATT